MLDSKSSAWAKEEGRKSGWGKVLYSQKAESKRCQSLYIARRIEGERELAQQLRPKAVNERRVATFALSWIGQEVCDNSSFITKYMTR